ncbi:MAG: segregation/condensation protein A [Bradyrhizobiaceae bacterium]|nr:segregation/condensation protein A [Bradyrhizobiaceae bacterium]
MLNIKLNNFEGPLDLLLFFIKRDELDIYDIPVASITQEFLEYVRIMEMLDLELAGEFVVMASMLVQIKAQMLLPRDERADADGNVVEELDPRTELVRRLLEYKRFKEASEQLSTQADEQRYVLYRQIFEAETIHAAESGTYRNATLFDLLKALKRAIERAPEESSPHLVTRYPVTVEEKTEEIFHLLKSRPSIRFFELISGNSKEHIVVTFLALLELAKNHHIRIQQDELFDDIVIAARMDDDVVEATPSDTELSHE